MNKNRLFLRRRKGQKILIGDPPNEVVLFIQEITDDDVTLGFMADAHVAIDRFEIAKRKGRI